MSLAELKALAPLAIGAYAGVSLSTLVGSSSSIVQILAGVAGAAAGIYLMQKIKL